MAKSISVPSRAAPDGGRPLTGWMVLAIVLAFFGTVTAVDGVMIYYALSTFSGEEEASPYEHGLAYGRDIAAAQAQDARHWQVAAGVTRAGTDGPAMIEVTMRDAQGEPLRGLALAASLEFPADKTRDRATALAETASGVYRASASVTAGQWDLVIEAKRGGEPVFRSRNRIIVR